MRRSWKAGGANDIGVAPRNARTIGTCRKGEDAGISKVDGFGRSHEVVNCWICGDSVFAPSLAANPR